MRTYEELIEIPTYEERYKYLKLDSVVGVDTFGSRRYLNQLLYASKEWKRIRRDVIARDLGRDLAHEDYEIHNGVKIIVHHMNPISIEDMEKNPEILFDPNYLICVSLETHNALHYGDESVLEKETIVERRPGDTTPWR